VIYEDNANYEQEEIEADVDDLVGHLKSPILAWGPPHRAGNTLRS
jgi:hypothetical protein